MIIAALFVSRRLIDFFIISFFGPRFFFSRLFSVVFRVRVSRDDSWWTATLLSNWTSYTLQLKTIWYMDIMASHWRNP